MQQQEFTEINSRLPVNGQTLSVVWTRSSQVVAERERRIVVMLHGGPEGEKDGPEQVFKRLAGALANHGIDSVRFDFRGQGESDGDYIDMTMAAQREDCFAVLSEVKDRGYSKVGIVGESFGATCALGVYQGQIDALALLWPAIYLMDVCFAPFFEEPYASQLKSDGFIQVGKDRLSGEFLDEVVQVDNLEDKVRAVTIPTILIHGSADSEVPTRQSERAFSILPEPKRLIIVAGGDHCLRQPHEQEVVIRETTLWLDRYL